MKFWCKIITERIVYKNKSKYGREKAMYKLIIVDDEAGIHELLKNAIEKLIGGYEVVGCFINGIEALEYINRHEVDVVLTDIKMPDVDGLELCKQLYRHYPEIKVIILSGYGEFEYAKKAIAYNVTDYLLKAVDIKELSASLRKIEKLLDYQNNKTDREDEVLERFCTDLIVGSLTREEIKRRYYELDIPYDIDDVKISIYQMDFENYSDIMKNAWRYESEYFQDAVLGVIQSVTKEDNGGIVVEILSNKERTLFGIFSDTPMNNFEESVLEHIGDIMGLRARCSNILDYAGLFEVSDNNNILDNKEIYKIMISYIKMLSTDKAKTIISRMMKLDEDEINTIDDKYEMGKNIDVDDAYDVIRTQLDDDTIISTAKAYIAQNFDKDISRQEVADEMFFNAAYFARFFKQETGITIGNYILQTRIDNAIKLLEQNIKVQDIAKMSGFKNIRHFQRVFKSYTGYSPTDYRRVVLKKDY